MRAESMPKCQHDRTHLNYAEATFIETKTKFRTYLTIQVQEVCSDCYEGFDSYEFKYVQQNKETVIKR